MIVERRLWGQSASVWLLLGATALLLFPKLGAAELWTLEGRWAGVCAHMMRSGDYVHPYLFGDAYYDKPLLSYWLPLPSARLLRRLHENAPPPAAGLLRVAGGLVSLSFGSVAVRSRHGPDGRLPARHLRDVRLLVARGQRGHVERRRHAGRGDLVLRAPRPPGVHHVHGLLRAGSAHRPHEGAD